MMVSQRKTKSMESEGGEEEGGDGCEEKGDACRNIMRSVLGLSYGSSCRAEYRAFFLISRSVYC